MLKHGFFPFHIVDFSPWPLYMSTGVYMILMSVLMKINNIHSLEFNLLISLIFTLLSLYGWFRDMVHEGLLEGNHTLLVQKGLKMGMLLFIVSEVLFFFSFFWSLFYYSISPSVELYSWPPSGLMTLDPMGMPFLGTLLLISSGVSVTWSHHSTIEGKKTSAGISLAITIILGMMFTFLQYQEYLNCSFTISDSVFGSIFFLSTGFHGIHVIIGSLMLMVSFVRIFFFHFSKKHHVGYEASIWYWHFVDVVWLLLYVCVYWWGSTMML
nr:cytochrome c oxidase subunit 3 [Colpocephalum spinicollis]